MKKVSIVLSLLLVLFCTGCKGYYSDPIEESSGYSEELDSEIYSKAKYEVKEITKEEYEEANGVNVFIDGWSNDKEEPRYMLFELYLYGVETEQYELIKITGLKYCPGAPQRYDGIAHIEYHNQTFNLNFEVSFNRTINLNEGVGVSFIDNNETKVIYLVKKN